jgi:hypothetical protein
MIIYGLWRTFEAGYLGYHRMHFVRVLGVSEF